MNKEGVKIWTSNNFKQFSFNLLTFFFGFFYIHIVRNENVCFYNFVFDEFSVIYSYFLFGEGRFILYQTFFIFVFYRFSGK